jgi:hypothetical protein
MNYHSIWNISVLVALNVADTAMDLETMQDRELVAEAMQVCSWKVGGGGWECMYRCMGALVERGEGGGNCCPLSIWLK